VVLSNFNGLYCGLATVRRRGIEVVSAPSLPACNLLPCTAQHRIVCPVCPFLCVSGAVFGSVPHIVQVDDYSEQLSFKVTAHSPVPNICIHNLSFFSVLCATLPCESVTFALIALVVLLPHTQPESNYILTFRNEDRPGVISEVLQVLNNANVNVASLNVTRAGAGQVSLEWNRGDWLDYGCLFVLTMTVGITVVSYHAWHNRLYVLFLHRLFVICM
jgi:ACT domain